MELTNWYDWTYLGKDRQDIHYNREVLCRCKCGEVSWVRVHALKTGTSKSCYTCYRTTHGMSGTRIYTIWCAMKRHCYTPATQDYFRYGGRGITVCDRWRDSFEAFYSDMGEPPLPKMELGRIDNNGNYYPENCRWETKKQQANNRRSNVTLTHEGITLTIAEWAERTGIGAPKLYYRYHRGLPVHEILATGDRRLR